MHKPVFPMAKYGMFRNLTPVVRALLYANLIMFGLEYVMPEPLMATLELWPWGSNIPEGAAAFQPWQLVSYAFLHDPRNFLHILSNMFALYMFGPDVEYALGRRRFTLYYFVCVIGAALTQEIVQHTVYPSPYPTLGASGAIFGLLLFYGMAFPRRVVLVFALLPMPVWLFVTLYGLFELYAGVSGTAVDVAHFAHLGGMASGYLLILFWRQRSRARH